MAETADPAALRAGIVEALKKVYDPELPVDVYELGLIYEIDVDEEGFVDVLMTLTSPACPVAGQMPIMVKAAVEDVIGVQAAEVELTWDPPWTQDRMSERARLELGFM
ncbi:SUF system Fe-S cluster assembly protein [Spiribacter sp. 2438]|uniref:SUF system Fe-S cluster assembly protein n=1 Tax=Spiribacter sp. 2438 TaxID=2666185 RepID=UPI0012B0BE0E|nr:SUF system Fe-S cluster assembly protein [Spiribacter sp. 2438]QGM21503.1 SUF system Fe-S cluster assembly protein [Spiribacter sp. 2438]